MTDFTKCTHNRGGDEILLGPKQLNNRLTKGLWNYVIAGRDTGHLIAVITASDGKAVDTESAGNADLDLLPPVEWRYAQYLPDEPGILYSLNLKDLKEKATHRYNPASDNSEWVTRESVEAFADAIWEFPIRSYEELRAEMAKRLEPMPPGYIVLRDDVEEE